MNSPFINRRKFLAMGSAGIGMFAGGGLFRYSQATAATSTAPFYKLSDIGSLQPPDENGFMLPPGFSCRAVAHSGQPPVGSSRYIWHPSPDGGACFPTDDGGWIYVSNSEVGGQKDSIKGGVGALKFSSQGEIVDAYSILSNTSVNCAGGATPWGTWLSAEEIETGQIYECDPAGNNPGLVRPALGTFAHEATAIDMEKDCVYLTEDRPNGGFYRFVATNGLPNLTIGRLEIAVVRDSGGLQKINWLEVPDPLAQTAPTRNQVADYTPFNGGEGIAFHEDDIYFVTKGDNRVWRYDTVSQQIEIIYDPLTSDNPILTGVDNVVITAGGDVLVAEDGGDMQLVAITPEGELFPLFKIIGQDRSEICGPAFDPSHQRLYFSSQRGSSGSRLTGGITYEITYTG